MRMTTIVLALMLVIFSLTSCKKDFEVFSDVAKTDILRVYCYDSFIQSSLSKYVVEEFGSRYDCTVELIGLDDEKKLLSRIISERGNPQADVAIGIMNVEMNRALSANVFLPYEAGNLRLIRDRSFLMDRRNRLTPFNYSFYAFMYDSEVVEKPPRTFGELQSSLFTDKIILINPSTSAQGFGILPWVLGVYGERGFELYWNRIKKNIFSYPGNYSDAYTAFLTTEAPIVLSYSTYLASHFENDKSGRYKAFIPVEGSFKAIEYVGIIEGAQNIFLARRFIEFVLSESFQERVPSSLWKYPVIDGVGLPNSFVSVPRPINDLTDKIFSLNDNFSERWVEAWLKIMATK